MKEDVKLAFFDQMYKILEEQCHRDIWKGDKMISSRGHLGLCSFQDGKGEDCRICGTTIRVINLLNDIDFNLKEREDTKASELEYLTWFRHNIDLGPGEQDVIDNMNERFIEETGKELPEGWGKE